MATIGVIRNIRKKSMLKKRGLPFKVNLLPAKTHDGVSLKSIKHQKAS